MIADDRCKLIEEITKLPETDKSFVLGYAAGVLAKASELPKPQKRKRKPKADRTA